MIVRKWMKWNIKVARPMFSINWKEVMKIRWTLFSFSWACYSSVQLGRSGSQNLRLWPKCAKIRQKSLSHFKIWQTVQIVTNCDKNRFVTFFSEKMCQELSNYDQFVFFVTKCDNLSSLPQISRASTVSYKETNEQDLAETLPESILQCVASIYTYVFLTMHYFYHFHKIYFSNLNLTYIPLIQFPKTFQLAEKWGLWSRTPSRKTEIATTTKYCDLWLFKRKEKLHRIN